MSRELRERREKDWFWIDNALVDRKDLNIYEKMLYICLARHLGSNEYCFPSLKLLKEELGLKDERTVVKYLRTLIEKGLIEAEKSKGKSNIYYLYNVKVDTSDVPAPNVPTSKAGTSHEGTFNQVGTSDVGRVPTFHAESSSMRCGYKNTTKNTNINIATTTQLDNKNNIDPDTLKDSSSSFNLIKNLLEQHGISERTKNNILELVKLKNISVNRVVEILKLAPGKNWKEGAIFLALKENWQEVSQNSNTSDLLAKPFSDKISKKLKGTYDYYLAGIRENIYTPKQAQNKFYVECEKYSEFSEFEKYYKLLGESI